MDNRRPVELLAQVRAAVRATDPRAALEAMDLLAPYARTEDRDSVTLLHGRFARLQRRIDSGVATAAEGEAETVRLLADTLSIAQRISDGADRPSASASDAAGEPAGPLVFVSHAGEDQALVAEPVAEALEQAGFSVWIDRRRIEGGDSLPAAVGDGLARCAAAVLIISPTYLAHGWTVLEANALISLEAGSGRPRLVPVRHGIAPDAVASDLRLLAHRLSLTTDDGVADLTAALVRALGDLEVDDA